MIIPIASKSVGGIPEAAIGIEEQFTMFGHRQETEFAFPFILLLDVSSLPKWAYLLLQQTNKVNRD